MSDPQALHAEKIVSDPPMLWRRLRHALLGASDAAEQHDALRAVLDLHKPQDIYPSGGSTGRPLCFGCDFDGYDAEHPEWPCPTVKVIAAALGVSTDG